VESSKAEIPKAFHLKAGSFPFIILIVPVLIVPAVTRLALMPSVVTPVVHFNSPFSSYLDSSIAPPTKRIALPGEDKLLTVIPSFP
jgi:hypothetical protein